MTDIFVRIKKKNIDLPTPSYKTEGSAGCDVTASEYVNIQPGCRCLVSTGLFLEVPPGYECQVRPRSGLAYSHGVTVLNSPGTIDSDYRGEVCVLLYNASITPFDVEPGMRIAQLVFAPVTRAVFSQVDDLTDTSRGTGGWGSTGVK